MDYHPFHTPHLSYLQHLHQVSTLKSVFVMATIRSFALSLIGIFGPLYILEILREAANLSLPQGIAGMLGIFLLLRLATILAAWPAALFQERFGFRYSTLTGNSLLAGALILLTLAKSNLVYLLPSAILWGISIPFYWLSFHLLITRDGHMNHIGSELAWLENLGRLGNALAPAMGGLIIVSQGFKPLYLLVVGLVILASLPLFFTPHHQHDPTPLISGRLWPKLFSLKNRGNFLAFAGAAAEGEARALIWPIFLFITYTNYERLGILVSASLVFSILAYFGVGKLVDRMKAQKLMSLGSKTNAAMWIFKFFARGQSQVFGVDLLDRSLGSLYALPFNALFYQKAQQNSLEFMLLREWSVNLARVATLLVVILLVGAGLDWKLSFWLAAEASLLTVNLVARKGN